MLFDSLPNPVKYLSNFNAGVSKALLFSLLALSTVVSGKLVSTTLKDLHQKRALKRKIQQKRAQVEDRKAKLRFNLLDGVKEKRKQITALSTQELIQKLQSGELKCVEVLRAFQSKALDVTEELNCVTEFIEEAEEWAKILDASTEKRPLHGVPFSVKDSVPFGGYDLTVGAAKGLGRPMPQDAYLVAALKGLGAIPFCRTNMPQTAITFGASNPVWGETRNPFNPSRTPGGSSSGEGCLIGSGASPFGIGSDVGGSVRVPAAFCNIVALKATIPRVVHTSATSGLVGVSPVLGIMARDADTLLLVHRLLWENGYVTDFSGTVVPLLWQEKLLHIPRKLRIGYYDGCEEFPTTPGVKRSIQICRDLLQDDGHELIPFLPPKLPSASWKFINFFHANELRAFDSLLQNEIVDQTYSAQHCYGRAIPWILRTLAARVVNLHSPIHAELLKIVGGRTSHYSHQLWTEIEEKYNTRENLIRLWKQQNLDLCIGPVFICPPPKVKDIDWFLVFSCYTSYYNYLDFPAGSVPVTRENEEDQKLLRDYPTNDSMLRFVKQTTEGALGMPIGVQVIGLPFQDELVLRGIKVVEELVQKKQAE